MTVEYMLQVTWDDKRHVPNIPGGYIIRHSNETDAFKEAERLVQYVGVKYVQIVLVTHTLRFTVARGWTTGPGTQKINKRLRTHVSVGTGDAGEEAMKHPELEPEPADE